MQIIDKNLLLQRTSAPPIGGRVMVRQLSLNENAANPILIIGLLQLPDYFVPEENATYLTQFADGQLSILPFQVAASSETNDHLFPVDIGSAMTARNWQVPVADNMMSVRFMEALPESNEWTCYGVSPKNIFATLDLDAAGHAWFDVTSGVITKITSPMNEVGAAPVQILRAPIWPSKDGNLYALPTMESKWRPDYHQMSLIYASYGSGEISKDQMHDKIKSNPRFDHIRQWNVDDQYCRFLAHLKNDGALAENKAMSLDEFNGQQKFIKAALKKSENRDYFSVGNASRSPKI